MSIQWSARNYAEDIAQAVHRILSSAGTDALTVRGIARVAQVSPGTLANQFESREGLLARTASVIGRLLGEDLAMRDLGLTGVDRVSGMVARDEYERSDLKVWLDLVALGRTSQTIGAQVRIAEARLRDLMGRCLLDKAPSSVHEDLAHEDPAHLVWLAMQAIWTHQLTPGKAVDAAEAQALLRSLVPEGLRS